MTLRVHITPSIRTGAVLLTGAAGFAALYAAGFSAIAWIAFALAGLLFSALDAPAFPPSEHQPSQKSASPQPTTVAQIEGHHYSVIPASTRVTVFARKLRWFTVLAAMHEVSARIDVDPVSGHPTIHGGVPVETFRSGNARRDAHVLGPAFLNAREHPTIRFTSTAVDPVSGDCVTVRGDLTLRGCTHPMSWHVSQLAADPSGDTLRAVAETAIRRSDWGMTGWGWLVDDLVTVRVEMVATRTAMGSSAPRSG